MSHIRTSVFFTKANTKPNEMLILFRFQDLETVFYPTALKGCWGIVFTYGVRMGGRRGKSLAGLYLRNRKV